MIIALDFDGVLHPIFPRADRSHEHNQYFSCLPALTHVLREFPEVKIIVSSTWAHTRTLDELRSFFPEDIQARIIGKTKKGLRSNQPGGRLEEVKAWMDEHAPGEEWIGIDDVAELYGEGCIIECLDEFGEAEAEKLRAALTDPQGFARDNPCANAERDKPRLRIVGSASREASAEA